MDTHLHPNQFFHEIHSFITGKLEDTDKQHLQIIMLTFGINKDQSISYNTSPRRTCAIL